MVLDEEQTLLQDNLRRWLRDNLLPVVAEHEAARTFPFEALKDLAGEKAEVAGTLAERDGMKIVTVTGSKAAS